MRLFLNGLAASAGGGLTYIRNVIPFLADTPGLQVTIALTPGLRAELRSFSTVDFLELDIPPARRFWYEQSTLPSVIRDCSADVLLSAGNFAVRNSPVPQILLSRNSLYTSADFYRDLRSRREYRAWLDTCLKAWLAKNRSSGRTLRLRPAQPSRRTCTAGPASRFGPFITDLTATRFAAIPVHSPKKSSRN